MTQATSIDYSELEKIKSGINISAPVLVVFVAIVLAVITLSINSDDIFVLSTLLVPFGVVGLLIYALFKSMANNKERQRLLGLFASANSFTYLPDGDFDWVRPGTLFEHGHSKNFNDVVQGNYYGLPFELFNYQYTVGSGKNQTTYDARVMEFTLPRSMPHMVIDSLVEQDDFARSTLPIDFDSSQRITLEGDFSQFFHLYAPDTYGVTALTILAPDAMQTLLKSAALCDMEIKDNKLYFYWPGKADTLEEYQTVFETSAAVLSEIGEKLTKSDVFASASQAVIHSQPGNGVRLEKSFWSTYEIIFTVAGFVIFYMLQFLGESAFFEVFMFIFITGPLGYYIFKARRQSNLRKTLAERYHQ